MPPDPIGVGIIGFGRIGAEHAAWLTRAQGIRAVAVADVTPARADLARSRGLRTYTTIEQLLDDRHVAAVLVAMPKSMNFDNAMNTLQAGTTVHVENPMALDHAHAGC